MQREGWVARRTSLALAGLEQLYLESLSSTRQRNGIALIPDKGLPMRATRRMATRRMATRPAAWSLKSHLKKHGEAARHTTGDSMPERRVSRDCRAGKARKNSERLLSPHANGKQLEAALASSHAQVSQVGRLGHDLIAAIPPAPDSARC